MLFLKWILLIYRKIWVYKVFLLKLYFKATFNGEKLKWELHKIRIPCPSCHKKRWLNAENRWKTLCKKCYLTS
ncbi:hypothetical protein FOA22_13900 [Heyndrickxia oleronia]